MTVIMEKIKQYRAGELSFSALRAFLRDHPYERVRPSPYVDVLDADANEDPPVHQDGTWDEVNKAKCDRLLTFDEYKTVLRDQWEKHAPARLVELESRDEPWMRDLNLPRRDGEVTS